MPQGGSWGEQPQVLAGKVVLGKATCGGATSPQQRPCLGSRTHKKAEDHVVSSRWAPARKSRGSACWGSPQKPSTAKLQIEALAALEDIKEPSSLASLLRLGSALPALLPILSSPGHVWCVPPPPTLLLCRFVLHAHAAGLFNPGTLHLLHTTPGADCSGGKPTVL